jgi:hypothetical protein
MSQVHNSTITRPVPIHRNRLIIGAAVFAAAIVAATAAGLAIFSVPVVTPTAPSAQHEDAADGWAPAMVDRSAAMLARMQDGYLPGLLSGRDTGDAVDGYLPGLLSGRDTGDAVDGYLPGLLSGRDTGDAVDGWESSVIR